MAQNIYDPPMAQNIYGPPMAKKHLCENLIYFEPIWAILIHLNKFDQVWTSMIQFEHVWASLISLDQF